MRILFLTSRLPYPPDRGDRLRTFQFLRLFAREHDVTLVSFVTGEKEQQLAANLAAYCQEMHLVPLPIWKSVANGALNAWRNLPLQTLYYRSGQMEKTIDDLLSSSSLDIVYVHLFRMAPYLAEHPGIYRILDLTDLISFEMRSSIPYQSPLWRLIYHVELPRIAFYEKQIGSFFNEVWFISQRDRELFLEEEPKANTHVVPHRIGDEFFSLDEETSDPFKLLFIGHLDVKHNIDAVRYMAEEIMPMILQEAPACKLYIVGAGDKQNVSKLNRLPGVRVVGFVPDLKTVFNQSGIAVAPLRFSAGAQTKVVESMAAGLPVVTTSNVSAGLGTLPERDLLVADSAADYAKQVLRLIKDGELRWRIGRAGRAYAEVHFSSQPAITRLEAIRDQLKN